MKISFNVGWWVEITNAKEDIIFETSDGNGNIIELKFDKKDFFAKRHYKQFIKDLEELRQSLEEKEQ